MKSGGHISRDADDTVAERHRVLRELRERYCDEGLVLAIGSGVSAGCRIPQWPVLLTRLAKRIYGPEGEAVYKKLVGDGYTLPAIAGMLEHHSYTLPEIPGMLEHHSHAPGGGGTRKLSPRERFTELLREELYASQDVRPEDRFPFFGQGVTRKNQDKLIRLVEEKNKTLEAVARLCVRVDQSGKFVPNPLIRAIVNFNFDAILREYVHERYGKEILRTIERPSAAAKPKLIPVYHLHGYLLFKKRNFRRLEKEAPDLRVFTEQEYFDSFNQPTRMGSYAFLHLLREHSCLFVGLSLKDDNIRRLLHYSRAERESAYEAEGEADAKSKSIRHFALLQHSADDDFDDLRKLSLERLGTHVIWYNDHDRDIPPLLREVYESRSTATGKRCTEQR